MGAKLAPAQQERQQPALVAGGGDQVLHRGVGELELLVAQQGLDHRRLQTLADGVGDHLSDAAPEHDQPPVLRTGVANAIEQVGVGQRDAGLQERARNLDLVAQQEAHEVGRHVCEGGEPSGDALALLHRRVAQHVDQEVGGHAALEGVHPARRQADHVGQPLEQRQARPRGRRPVQVRQGLFQGEG